METELVGKAILDRPADWTLVTLIEGLRDYVLDIRFLNSVDRDSVYSRITRVQARNNIRNWVLAASISRHECSHEDAVIQPCTTTEYAEVVI